MKQTLCILFAATSCFYVGCSNEQVAQAKPAAIPLQEKQADADTGIGSKIGSLVEQAKSKTPSIDDVKNMLNGVGDATEKTTDDAMTWANETFQSLRKQGKTRTKNVQDWLVEDWNNASAWEYQVVSVNTSTPEILQEKLNEAGKQRWDCFHVSNSSTATTLYMKRQKESYMKNLPLKDMLKLVPLVPLLDSE